MNILIVEDHVTDMKLLDVVLTSGGHAVSGAGSTEEALRSIKAEPPQLIVMDLKLPGTNGLELARLLKADPETRHIPIVAVTAERETFTRDAALAAGCDAYVLKPVNTREFNDIVGSTGANAPRPEERRL